MTDPIDTLAKLNELAAPAPWRVITDRGNWAVASRDGNIIADCGGGDRGRADARLIAVMRSVLPELLAVARQADDDAEFWEHGAAELGQLLEDLRSALRKALEVNGVEP